MRLSKTDMEEPGHTTLVPAPTPSSLPWAAPTPTCAKKSLTSVRAVLHNRTFGGRPLRHGGRYQRPFSPRSPSLSLSLLHHFYQNTRALLPPTSFGLFKRARTNTELSSTSR